MARDHGSVPAALAWLAGAVVGRPMRIAPLPPGQASYTDGSAIHLDSGLSLKQQRLVVVAHSLLLAAGSLPGDIAQRLRYRPSLSRRYLGLELARTAVVHADRLPPNFSTALNLPAASQSRSLAESYALALAGEEVPLPGWLGELRPRQALVAVPLATGSVRRAAQDESSDDDQALNADDHELLEKFRTPLRAGLGLADMLLRLLGYRRGAGSANRGDNESAAGSAAALANAAGHADGDKPAHAAGPRARSRQTGAPDGAGTCYPEWDEARQRYRPNHVRVGEIIPSAEDDEGNSAPPPLHLPGLSAALARIGVRYQHMRGRNKGDDLDLDAVIDVTLQRRSGHSTHDNIYIATEPSRRDLSVLLLLDISRSTADRGTDGLTVLQRHGAIVRRLLNTFESLGDRVAGYGFHSWGRERVRFVRLKHFGERASVAAERIDALTPAGFTRMGAAIRHATALLGADRHHSHRLMLMFTDGFAYDDGYEGAYARADTARALAEAAARGIACVCVNIGSDQDDEILGQLYGEAAYLRSADATAIVSPLRNLMSQALYRASLARMRRQNAMEP